MTAPGPRVETERLLLRPWLPEEDLKPFARLGADPRVMEFLGPLLSEEETAEMIRRLQERFREHGFSFWATELKSSGELIGFVGLNVPRFEAPFMPCVEVGWRLAREHWGKGYAQEAARASLDYGFDRLGLEEIVSLTSEINVRSRRVMERIGMRHDAGSSFDHPSVAPGDPLRRHVLYRISRAEWDLRRRS